MDKVQCIQCGAMILQMTAEKYSGCCAQCKKLALTPIKVAPSRVVFVIAACILFATAASTSLQIATHKGLEAYVIGVVIDASLGVMLLRHSERARFLAVARAVLGLLVGGALLVWQSSGVVLTTGLLAQIALSSSLVIFLAWKTVRWRLVCGVVLAAFYLVLLALGALGTVLQLNAA